MARELGVSDHVTFTGPKRWEIIDQYYALGDVFVRASHSETQGLTYIEAMASGLCVCAVNDACLDKLFENVTSLYRLDQGGGTSAVGKKELGELPTAAKALLGTLAVVWVCIGLYLLREWKKGKKIKKND